MSDWFESISDDDPQVRLRALFSGRMHDDPKVRAHTASLFTHEGTLTQLAGDSEDVVRAAVAKNRKAPVALLRALLYDPSVSVVRMAFRSADVDDAIRAYRFHVTENGLFYERDDVAFTNVTFNETFVTDIHERWLAARWVDLFADDPETGSATMKRMLQKPCAGQLTVETADKYFGERMAEDVQKSPASVRSIVHRIENGDYTARDVNRWVSEHPSAEVRAAAATVCDDPATLAEAAGDVLAVVREVAGNVHTPAETLRKFVGCGATTVMKRSIVNPSRPVDAVESLVAAGDVPWDVLKSVSRVHELGSETIEQALQQVCQLNTDDLDGVYVSDLQRVAKNLVALPNSEPRTCAVFITFFLNEFELEKKRIRTTFRSYLMWDEKKNAEVLMDLALSGVALAQQMVRLYPDTPQWVLDMQEVAA